MSALIMDGRMPAEASHNQSGALAVRVMKAGDQIRWDEFVQRSPQATFFHRSGWKEVIERAFGHRTHFLLAESDGRIEGVLPLAQTKSMLFGHALASLPFCVYGGVAADTDRARAALDREAIALAERLGVDHLEYRSQRRSCPDWATKDLYVTFRKAIDPDPEKNMNAIPRKQRAMVRKGIKAGLKSDVATVIDIPIDPEEDVLPFVAPGTSLKDMILPS